MTATSQFEKNIIDTYGNQGRSWLNSLDSAINYIARKYGLRDLKPVSNMSFNFVATGFKKEQPIVLKYGLNNNALKKEADCLEVFKNHGCVELILHENNIMIMHQALPGISLKSFFPLQEEESVTITCQLIQKLHAVPIPLKHKFYHISDLLRSLDKPSLISPRIINRARILRDKLLASTTEEVLLHGDLHHDNILHHGDRWLAIDPKGFIGEPAYDCCAFINNPIPELMQQNDPKALLINRIE